MKLNWGGKLFIFAAAFMLFVATMVVIISKQEMPLVEQDYYERGLNYQQQIDNNANMDTSITMIIEGEQLKISGTQHVPSVKVNYYRPSNPDLDQNFTLSIMAGKQEVLNLSELAKGKWILSATWFVADKEYKLSKEFDKK